MLPVPAPVGTVARSTHRPSSQRWMVASSATDLHVACGGGSGGAGGKGGSGGGGRGGHSIGIAHTGAAPEATRVTITVGAAGAGGTGTGPMTKAGPGVTGQVQAF